MFTVWPVFECFVFWRCKKINLSITLVLNTKETRSRVGLVSCPFCALILRLACNWNLHQRYFLKRMLFSVVIWFDTCIFHNQKSFLLTSAEIEKVTRFFFKLIYLWKKIFISRYDLIIFINKSWSVNSGWLTLFVLSKVMRGNSFDFKMLLTIFNLQKQSF